MADEIRSPRAKRKGVQILCGRDSCKQLLALSLGDCLDCFAFTVAHRVKMKCETCGHETRWGPDKSVDSAEPPQ